MAARAALSRITFGCQCGCLPHWAPRANTLSEVVSMHVLVTAGNTLVLVDRVRCLTNIFTGRTGASIALAAHARGHRVRLLTSHPDAMPLPEPEAGRWSVQRYRTFDDLQFAMATALTGDPPDVLIHTAAVSDYLAGGVYAPDSRTQFDPDSGRWDTSETGPPALVDRAAAKVKSDEPELWLRLVRAPKLIDLVRSEWAFRGIVVKFKLEVAISDEQLLEIAERSRKHSAADLMVANTLESAANYAFLGPVNGTYERVVRRNLATRLVDVLETLGGGAGNG
jgi:phosphopantothenoylcysteine synthetase/decarboxylase